MPNFFDIGVRKHPASATYRGQCDICLAHQGLSTSDDALAKSGGWGTYAEARNWIVTHLDRVHKESISPEMNIALGMSR